MKRKIVKIIFAVICCTTVLWCAMFITDFIRCSDLKMPIFAVASETADDGGSGTYTGIGYEIDIDSHMVSESDLCVDYIEMRLFAKIVTAAIGCH